MKKCFLIIGLLILSGCSAQPSLPIIDATVNGNLDITSICNHDHCTKIPTVSYHEETKCLRQEMKGAYKCDGADGVNGNCYPAFTCTKYDKKRCYLTINGQDNEIGCAPAN